VPPSATQSPKTAATTAAILGRRDHVATAPAVLGDMECSPLRAAGRRRNAHSDHAPDLPYGRDRERLAIRADIARL
jgi:hypothetical protein